MSYPAAVQSAVFYFLACTPCMQVRQKKKARETARRERAEKARLEAANPTKYHHPSPFHTNPYWSEEISLGPSLSRKGGSKDSSQGRLASSGKDSTTPSVATSENASSVIKQQPSLGPVMEGGQVVEGWNKRRYQREDEELWGQWPAGLRFMDAIVKAGSSAGHYIEAKLGIGEHQQKPDGEQPAARSAVTQKDRHEFYLTHKNPPVNDYHPPVVSSKPAHKDAHRWMLQPPPPAKIMEGKVPVGRARGLSAASRATGATPASAGSSLEQFWRPPAWSKDETPSEAELIESVIGRPAPSRSLTGRSRSLCSDSGSMESPMEEFRPNTCRPGRRRDRAAEAESDEDEGVVLSRSFDSLGTRSSGPGQHVAQKPKLETIMSDRTLPRLRG